MKKEDNTKQYEIYCLYHNKVFSKYYGKQIDQVTFVKMDKEPYVFGAKKHIYLAKEKWFHPIGKEWAEYEFYYSLYQGYKEGLIELPEYLCFIQYDMEFTSTNPEYGNTTVLDVIEKELDRSRSFKDKIIAFIPHTFNHVYKNNSLVLDDIIAANNSYRNINLSKSYYEKRNLNQCGSFFFSREIFLNAMGFLEIFIKSKKFKTYNLKYRKEGVYAEFILSVYISSLSLSEIYFPLRHQYLTSKNEITLFDRIYKIIGIIGLFINHRYPYIYKIIKPCFPDRE